MSDVFISYASEDRKQAAVVGVALEQIGWSVWWDRVIPTGRPFADVIKEQLDAAKAVVVVWSSAAVASKWVQREARTAAEQKKLFPVVVEDVTPPWEFSDLQTCDLRDWDGNAKHPNFERLVIDLQLLLGTPGQATAYVHSRTERPIAPDDSIERDRASTIDPHHPAVVDAAHPQRFRLGWKIGASIGALHALIITGFAEQPVSYLFAALAAGCWTVIVAITGVNGLLLATAAACFVAGGWLWSLVLPHSNYAPYEWPQLWWWAEGGAIIATVGTLAAYGLRAQFRRE